MKFRLFLKSFLICTICFLLFFGFGYFYLNKNIKSVNQNTENVPYRQISSENAGVLFIINGQETFVYLDFFENKITVSLSPEPSFANAIYGYSHNYTIKGNNELTETIIDNVGGIELEINGEVLRYTGLQVSDILKHTNSTELKRNIVTAIIKNIAKYGVDSSFVVNIINCSDSDLNLSKCYLWNDLLQSVCGNIHFID